MKNRRHTLTICSSCLFCTTFIGICNDFRYGQFDPYDRPQASLGYNMDLDDNDFTNGHSGPVNDDSYGQMYSNQRANGLAGYYGYGAR